MAIFVDFQMVGRIVDSLQDGRAIFEFIRRMGGGDGVAVENQAAVAWILDDIAVAEINPFRIVVPWTGLNFRNESVFRVELKSDGVFTREAFVDEQLGGLFRTLQRIGVAKAMRLNLAFAVN